MYDYNQNKIQELSPMLSPHWGHASIYLNPKTIFVISGSYCKKCESYDLNKKSWSNLSEINIWRMDATPFLFNSTRIYIFGGWNNSIKRFDPFIDKIEKLKIDKDNSDIKTKNKWEFVNIISNIKSILNPRDCLKKICMGVVNLSDNRLLLLGGDTSSYLIDNFYESDKLNSPTKEKENVSIYHDSMIEIKINFLGDCELVKISKLTRTCCFVSKKTFNEIPNSGKGNLVESIFCNFCHDSDLCRIDYNNDEASSTFLD